MRIKSFNLKDVNLKEISASIGVAIGSGLISLLISGKMFQTYKSLVKPFFAPPGWVFGVVWNILFVLLGISSYYIYSSRGNLVLKKRALTCYGIMLAVNTLWTFFFFKLKLFLFSLFLIGAIIILVFLTGVYFYKIKKSAGYLLIPMSVWLVFAMLLTACVYFLN